MKEHAPAPVLSVLRIPVRPGCEEPLVRSFGELGVFERAACHAGFRSGRILRPLQSGDPIVVIAEWDGPEWYRAWLADPVRGDLQSAVADLVDGEMAGGIYVEATGGAE